MLGAIERKRIGARRPNTTSLGTVLSLLYLLIVHLVIGASAAELKVLAFGYFSHQTAQGLQWFMGATRTELALFPLAIQHFNRRDGSIIPAFATRQCDLNINLVEYQDDEGSATVGMKRLIVRPNLNSLHAVLGPTRSLVAQPMAAALTALEIPIVSSWATSAELSDQKSYGFFSRTCPSDNSLAKALASLLVNFKYDKLGMLYVNDDFGRAWKDSLLAECQKVGVDLVYVAFDDDIGADLEKGVSDALLVLKQYKLNVIFFVFGLQTETFFYLAQAAKRHNMLTEDHLYMHAINDLHFADAAFPHSIPLIREFLRGSISVQNSVPGLNDNSERNPTLDAFVRLWPTFNESDVNPTFPANPDVQDDSPFFFPPGYFASTTSQIFNAFTWAYDAVATVGLAACQVYREEGMTGLNNGTTLLDAIRSMDFDGVSGHVRFSAGTGDRDPQTSVVLANNVIFNSTDGSVSFRTVGVFLPSNQQWTLHVDQAVFRDGTSDIPPDVTIPNHDMQHLPSWAKILGSVEAALGLLMGLISFAWLWTWQRHLIVVQSQPIFMGIIALGILSVSASVIPLTMEEETGACMAFPFLYSIGITLACSSISAKNLRVGVLWYRLKDRKQDRGSVYLALISLMVGVNLILMFTWTFVAPLTFQRVVIEKDINGLPVKSYGSCTATESTTFVFLGLVLGHLALVMIWTGLVSIWVHHAPRQFQDSKWTALGACALGQVYLLGIPIVVIIYQEPAPRFVALSSICFLTAVILFGTMFVQKMIVAGKHPELTLASTSSPRQPEPAAAPPLLRANTSPAALDSKVKRPGVILLRFSPVPPKKRSLPKQGPAINQPLIPPRQEDVDSPKAKAHRSETPRAGDSSRNLAAPGQQNVGQATATPVAAAQPRDYPATFPSTINQESATHASQMHQSNGDAVSSINGNSSNGNASSTSQTDTWNGVDQVEAAVNELVSGVTTHARLVEQRSGLFGPAEVLPNRPVQAPVQGPNQPPPPQQQRGGRDFPDDLVLV